MTLGGDRVFLLWSIKMSNIIPFQFEDFSIRTVEIDDVVWFVAADVCDALDIGNTSQAMTRLDNDEKGIISNDTPGGDQNMIIINESGLYSLVLGSKKPEAKKFKKWVTSEVLPSIRKTGQYSIQNLSPANQLLVYAQQLVAHEEKIGWLNQEQQLMKQRQDVMLQQQELLNIEQGLMKREHIVHAKEIDLMKHQVKALVEGENHFTIVAHQSLLGKSVDLKTASSMGKQATKYCKENNIKMGKANHPVFGTCNTYPKDVLDLLFVETA